MVASLIVVLPNPFEGGRLIVRHGAAKQKLAFEEAAAGTAACFAAFYADCEHEVERVTRGVRIALAYNLVLKPQPGKPSDAARPRAGASNSTPIIAGLLIGTSVQAYDSPEFRPLSGGTHGRYYSRGFAQEAL